MQTNLESFYDYEQCPYRAWRQCLPGENYSSTSSILPCLEAAKVYLGMTQDTGEKREEMKDKLMEQRYFEVDLKNLVQDKELTARWPSIKEDLEDRSEVVAGVLSLARHQMVVDSLIEEAGDDPELLENVTFPLVRARFTKHSPITQLKVLKSSFFGKLVTIGGTVIRVSSIRPVCTWLAYRCSSCQVVQVVHQPEGKHKTPDRCTGLGCRTGRNFLPLRTSPQTVCVDMQTVRLQEIVQDECGRVPRSVECEMTEDLCDRAVPGDVVTITGVVKVVSSEEAGKVKKKASNRSMFLLYISALSILNSRSNGNRSSNIGAGIEFTYNDYAAVQEIHSFGDNIFKLLANSLCPSIYGHELVKAGLVLGLFGGTNKNIGDRNQLQIRGDPHILVVGDPGLGKSQMLSSTSNVAPRGVFVTGNTTTTAGLTVTLTRDSGSDFSLEAGALVLADQGCCCIDEFDKMTSQHQALLEAMEQQCISIAKAGVVCSLPARTAVLAAANPVGGHYNKAKTVAENLKLGPALLSRFDLVFILIDKPDEELDSLLSDHVMALHLPNLKQNKAVAEEVQTQTLPPGASLAERLKNRSGELLEPVPHPILRKYIAYARKYVFPKLSEEACDVLQSFYLELRQRHQTSDSTPITTRQLESMIRLTEAKAKLQLSELATEQDALDVVEIMKLSMVDTFSDGDGLLDFSRNMNGSGMSKKNAAKTFVSSLQRQAHNLQKNIFSIDEMRQVAQVSGVKVNNFLDFIESLNNQGYIIKKSARVYQLLSADY